MIKHYYTYADLTELLSCSKRTLERKIPQMKIQKRYLVLLKEQFNLFPQAIK